ncbi:MAG: YceI family protein [Candidatus Rokubacteria bacterium]|nr:YceI family protein [Candidatus Rokubacteria bacterium]
MSLRIGIFCLGLLLAVTSAQAEPRRWTVVAGRSQVWLTASFPLGDFTGRTEDLGGEFLADPTDIRQGVTGTLRVNATTLRTGVDGRDRDMRQALGVDGHPEIRFVVQAVEPSFSSITEAADVLLAITGSMIIRGVERPMTVPGRVRFRSDQLWVRGESRLRMTDFGITPPRRLFLTVRDEVGVAFDVTLAPAQ